MDIEFDRLISGRDFFKGGPDNVTLSALTESEDSEVAVEMKMLWRYFKKKCKMTCLNDHLNISYSLSVR